MQHNMQVVSSEAPGAVNAGIHGPAATDFMQCSNFDVRFMMSSQPPVPHIWIEKTMS